VTDILRELEKPGRDPRPAFKAAVFMDGVESLDDLRPGMTLEGTVTTWRHSAPSSTLGFTRMAWCTSRRCKKLRQGSREVVKLATSSASRSWRLTRRANASR